jgi:hypothetical protein
MSFNLTTYQPHLKAAGLNIYQTYYLDGKDKEVRGSIWRQQLGVMEHKPREYLRGLLYLHTAVAAAGTVDRWGGGQEQGAGFEVDAAVCAHVAPLCLLGALGELDHFPAVGSKCAEKEQAREAGGVTISLCCPLPRRPASSRAPSTLGTAAPTRCSTPRRLP